MKNVEYFSIRNLLRTAVKKKFEKPTRKIDELKLEIDCHRLSIKNEICSRYFELRYCERDK